MDCNLQTWKFLAQFFMVCRRWHQPGSQGFSLVPMKKPWERACRGIAPLSELVSSPFTATSLHVPQVFQDTWTKAYYSASNRKVINTMLYYRRLMSACHSLSAVEAYFFSSVRFNFMYSLNRQYTIYSLTQFKLWGWGSFSWKIYTRK